VRRSLQRAQVVLLMAYPAVHVLQTEPETHVRQPVRRELQRGQPPDTKAWEALAQLVQAEAEVQLVQPEMRELHRPQVEPLMT
jgi:hypothetical protein